MKHQRHPGSVDSGRDAAQARILIADLSRIVEILNVDIASEEQKVGGADLVRPGYPVLARELRARRDNLQETISVLRQRLVQP